MYAIVEIAGKQFRVEKNSIVKVPYLRKEEGEEVEFERVLLLDDGQEVKVGHPVVEGVKVTGKVVENGRDKKVIIFKKKRRKGYQKKQGHRQYFSKVQIENIA